MVRESALFRVLFWRECLTLMRRPADLLQAWIFFLLLGLLPLFFASSGQSLAEQAPVSLWTALVLAQLLAFNAIWEADEASGCLAQILLGIEDVYQLIAGKCLAYLCLHGLPMLFVAPICGMMLHLNWSSLLVLMASFILGLPVLVLLGCFLSFLMLLTHRQATLLALLLMPLVLPVMLLGVGSTLAALHQESIEKPLGLMVGMLCLAMAFLPGLIAQALTLYKPMGLSESKRFVL